jgi:hypothetical protein
MLDGYLTICHWFVRTDRGLIGIWVLVNLYGSLKYCHGCCLICRISVSIAVYIGDSANVKLSFFTHSALLCIEVTEV